MGVVAGPVEVGVGVDDVAILVNVSIDEGSNSGELGHQVHGVFVGDFPVSGFMETVSVSLSELGVGLEVQEGGGELSHGVHVSGEGGDEFLGVLGEIASSSQVFRDVLEFRGVGDLAGHEEPEETLAKRFVTSGSLLEEVAEIGDGVFSEGDTVLGVKEGSVPDKTEHISHTTEGLVDSDGTDLLVTVLLLDVLELGLLLGNDFLELFLESRVEAEDGSLTHLSSGISENGLANHS